MKKFLYIFFFTFSLISAQEAYKPKNFYYLLGMEGFSDKLLTNHITLYKGYVKATNSIVDKLNDLVKNREQNTLTYRDISRQYAWEYNGMKLHELYFENLGGTGRPNVKSQVYKKIVDSYGTLEEFKKQIIQKGMTRGIGWVVVFVNPSDGHLMTHWVSDHDGSIVVGSNIILCMDAWEHAYMTEYGLDREEYIKAFIANIDYAVCESRYNKL